jgi:hypothetical protein
MPYKRAIGKMTNGLLSESSSTMVLSLGHPYIYANHIIRLQAVVKIVTNETTRVLNLLAKQSTKMHTPSIRTAWL